MGRFSTYLESRLGDGATNIDRACARLRAAAYIARKGEVVEARHQIAGVRHEFRAAYVPVVYAEINVAEGVVEYFDRGPRAALDKFDRAFAMAAQLGAAGELPALAAAWQAACYKHIGDWLRLSDRLETALERLHLPADEALCRLSLVIADLLQETGEYDDASIAYNIVRKIAGKIGDDSAVSAIIYNRAAIRLFNARISAGLGNSLDPMECRAEIEAASAENYTLYSNERSMVWVFVVMRAQFAMLRGDWVGAVSEFQQAERLLGEGDDWASVRTVLCADQLLAKLHVAERLTPDLELAATALIDSIETTELPCGDRIIALSSLLQACKFVGLQRGDDVQRSLTCLEGEYAHEIEQKRIILGRVLGAIGQSALVDSLYPADFCSSHTGRRPSAGGGK